MECTSCGTTSTGAFCPGCGARKATDGGTDDAGRFWQDDEPTRAQAALDPGPGWPQPSPETSWDDWIVQPTPPTGPGPLPVTPTAGAPTAGASMAPPPGSHGGPPWTAIVAAVVAGVLLLGAGGAALWFFGSDGEPAAGPPSTSTPTTTVTATPPPTTTVTSTATPPPTTTVTTTAAPPSAAEQLSDKRDESLARLDTDGDWAVSLSAKQDGTRDDRQVTSSGSHVFRLPDILELHEGYESTYAWTDVYLLKAEDLGSTVGADDDKIWMTIVDPGWLTTREDAEAWCAVEFSWLSGDDLDNACYPRQLRAP